MPEDSGPKISTMRPRGRPPMPSARSSASEPVETAPTETCGRSLILMTDPLAERPLDLSERRVECLLAIHLISLLRF